MNPEKPKNEILSKFSFNGNELKDYKFPEQKVFLYRDGKVKVTLDDIKYEIEIDRNIGVFIDFMLRLKKRELEHKDAQTSTSEFFKNVVSLSNCHRVMMVAMGFKVVDTLENDFGSAIVDRYFSKNKVGFLEIENKIRLKNKKDFPLSVNLFGEGVVHSFVVLGFDNLSRPVCFHKDGFGENKKVELTDLSDILNAYSSKDINFATIYSQEEVEEMYDIITRNEKWKSISR